MNDFRFEFIEKRYENIKIHNTLTKKMENKLLILVILYKNVFSLQYQFLFISYLLFFYRNNCILEFNENEKF